MNILLVNNSVRGSSGIDAVVKSEERALLRLGHSVHLYTRDNSEFTVARGLERTRLALATLYSYRSRREVRALCAQHAFDVIHFHNLAPLLTGAAYDGTRDSKAFIVQHLHNYRAFCPAAYAFRRNQFCSECTRGAFLPCAWHGCYRHSRAASSALVMVRWMDWLHGRQSGAAPDAWIAVSSAVSNRSIEHAGLPADRVETLDNPVADLAGLLPEPLRLDQQLSKQLIFAGSLIRAKGTDTLIPLALALPDFEITILGVGEEKTVLHRAAMQAGVKNVRLLGVMEGEAKVKLWAPSFLTLVPSIWEEAFGLVAAESLSLGIPVLTSGAGGLKGIVRDNHNGFIVDFNRLDDVAQLVRALWSDTISYMMLRRQARCDFESRFTEDIFGARLEALFKRLIVQKNRAKEQTSCHA